MEKHSHGKTNLDTDIEEQRKTDHFQGNEKYVAAESSEIRKIYFDLYQQFYRKRHIFYFRNDRFVLNFFHTNGLTIESKFSTLTLEAVSSNLKVALFS